MTGSIGLSSTLYKIFFSKIPYQEGKLQNFTIISRRIMPENNPGHFLNT